MKLKITITGPKVHDVGYRPWLTELAMNTALRGFEVYNDEADGEQAVIALAEADERRIQLFLNAVRTKQLQLAKVDKIESCGHTESIMPLWQAAAMNTSIQLNKAIPLLLEMRDDLKAVRVNTDLIPQMAENVEGLREDLTQNTNRRLEGIEKDMRVVKKKLGIR